MPVSIITLYALVISSFIADQLSSFMDAHWQIAEFSFRDPWHIGMTIFWGAMIILILFCIKRKQPYTPKIFLYLGFVCIAFLIFEALDPTQPASAVFFSFQAIESVSWYICFAMCSYNSTLKAWFAPTDHEKKMA
jgi:hypothetical protein